jgi:hypothetical protein
MTEQENTNDTFLRLKKYVRVRYEIEKLRLVEKISSACASIISGSLIFLLMCASIIFLSLTLAYYLSQYFNNNVIGFGIVGLVYLGVTVFLHIFRKRILISSIRDRIINEFLQ